MDSEPRDDGHYNAAYVAFMQECKGAYDDLVKEITAGNVPAGQKATAKITIPRAVIDSIRYDLLAAEAKS